MPHKDIEARRRYMREWQQKNRDKTREYQRKWRKEREDPEKLKARKKRFAQKHPDKVRHWSSVTYRRWLLKQYNITEDDYANCLIRQNHCCAICKEDFDSCPNQQDIKLEYI